jgi:hypothetical protein
MTKILASVLTMMSANRFGSVRRPSVLTVSWKSPFDVREHNGRSRTHEVGIMAGAVWISNQAGRDNRRTDARATAAVTAATMPSDHATRAMLRRVGPNSLGIASNRGKCT